MNASALNSAGVQAHHIADLWWLMFWVCLGVFIAVMIYLLIATFRRRSLVLVGRPGMPDPAVERRLTRLVVGAVGVTVGIVFVFLIASFITEKKVSALSTPNPLTIEVIGHQWWWEIRYDDPAPDRIVQTANEIHMPVGQPVLLKLFSRDVIHSFWVPSLNGKRDLIPGQENTFWIEADREGAYTGECAEFCGHQHANMRFAVLAEPPEKFQSWLAAQRQPAHAPQTTAEEHGRQVFLAGSCILCHTIAGTPAAGNNGPNLTHIASRPLLAAGAAPNTRGHLAGWVLDSQNLKPGNHMPPANLSSTDLQDLLAYLGGLK
jgi:cytochrome c oxidase subunit II